MQIFMADMLSSSVNFISSTPSRSCLTHFIESCSLMSSKCSSFIVDIPANFPSGLNSCFLRFFLAKLSRSKMSVNFCATPNDLVRAPGLTDLSTAEFSMPYPFRGTAPEHGLCLLQFNLLLLLSCSTSCPYHLGTLPFVVSTSLCGNPDGPLSAMG